MPNEAAIKRLEDQIKRLEMTPNHDPVVLKKLRDKLKELKSGTFQGNIQNQHDTLMKRNKLLSKLKGGS